MLVLKPSSSLHTAQGFQGPSAPLMSAWALWWWRGWKWHSGLLALVLPYLVSPSISHMLHELLSFLRHTYFTTCQSSGLLAKSYTVYISLRHVLKNTSVLFPNNYWVCLAHTDVANKTLPTSFLHSIHPNYIPFTPTMPHCFLPVTCLILDPL